MPSSTPSADAVAELVASETTERLRTVVQLLVDGEIDLRTSRARLELALPPGPRTVDRVLAVIRAWGADHGDSSTSSLASSVAAALAVRERVEERGPQVELAWTGPSAASHVRNTRQIVLEMLRRGAREVLIVQYAVTGGHGSKEVFEQLGALAADGVRVTAVVDARWSDGRSLRSLRSAWPDGTPWPRVLSYEVEDDELAKLHAKVLLVDGRDLFVSSANLTGYGLGVNLEFGVRVQGRPAVQAKSHFDALLASDLLDEVEL